MTATRGARWPWIVFAAVIGALLDRGGDVRRGAGHRAAASGDGAAINTPATLSLGGGAPPRDPHAARRELRARRRAR